MPGAPTKTAHQKLREEIEWLKEHPWFAERPMTLLEFLGPDGLDIEDKVRAAIKEVLRDIMGEEVNPRRPTAYELAMVTGGIGIGKTTIASIVLPYLVHWCLCLKDAQDFFGLLPGSRIAFMQMSTSEQQAKEVVFGDIKARIEHSPWFKKHPTDPAFKNQFRFRSIRNGQLVERDIWIIPGDSAETTFEGYNILGGILDEADSHKVTKAKDYAEQGFETIFNRMSSRFEDRGFLLVIGQMKKATGFAAKKFKELRDNPKAYAVSMPIWVSRGDDYFRCKEVGPHELNPGLTRGKECGEVHKFYFDPHRKQIIPRKIANLVTNAPLMEIPEVYRQQFETNPEKALKDLAGIPPAVGDPFISLVHKIHEARDRWVERYGDKSPVRPDGRIETWFRAQDTLRRCAHVDIAYAEDGDALGIAMGHVPEIIEIDGERKPFIVIDFLMRMTAPAGGEIFLGEMRHVLYALRNDLGFRLEQVTFDGFQSQDTMQQLQRRRFLASYLSIDRQVLPYHDLREAIYEDRIAIPPYMVHLRPGDSELTEIAIKELTELVDNGNKVDHPEGGSKDVADAIAGVTYTLMGDRRYHRKVTNLESFRQSRSSDRMVVGGLRHPAYLGDTGLRAPKPPSLGGRFR